MTLHSLVSRTSAGSPARRSGTQFFKKMLSRFAALHIWTPDLAMALRATRSGVRKT
jgi:hypothetical protein